MQSTTTCEHNGVHAGTRKWMHVTNAQRSKQDSSDNLCGIPMLIVEGKLQRIDELSNPRAEFWVHGGNYQAGVQGQREFLVEHKFLDNTLFLEQVLKTFKMGFRVSLPPPLLPLFMRMYKSFDVRLY